MATWIKSDGVLDKAYKSNEAVRIRGPLGGVIEFNPDEWRERNGGIEVKEGADVIIIENPSQASSMSIDKELDVLAKRCRKVACIGLILICCDNGKVVGGCIGVSGC